MKFPTFFLLMKVMYILLILTCWFYIFSILMNMFIKSMSFLEEILEFCHVKIGIFEFFFPIWIPFISLSLSYLTVLSLKTSGTILKKRGEKKHSYSTFYWKFSILCIYYNIDWKLAYITFITWDYVLSISSVFFFLAPITKGCWSLLKTFSARVDMVMCFKCFTVLNCS